MTAFKHFYVNNNPQPTGEHEIHKEGCEKLKEVKSRIYIGYCLNCKEAIERAAKIYPKVDGCYYCCDKYHNV